MKHKNLSRAVLVACVIVTVVDVTWLFGTQAAAQTSQAQSRNLPMFEVDPSWPKVPPKWKLGDVSSIAIDAQGNGWVLHRPRTLKADQAALAAPPIVVFDPAGNFIKAWGGAGSGKGNADTKNVHRAADVWVHAQTNEAFVADGYGNHRVIVFDADSGAFKRMWGAFANMPVDDDHCENVPKPNFADAAGPENFSIVHAIRVANDGIVYVADRENRRVQMFTNDGKFLKQLVKTATPFARNLALSPDSEQQFLYVGDGKEISIVDRKTLEIAGSIQGQGMLGGGHQIATDAKGNIYVAATGNGMQKLTFKGMSPLASR